MAEKLHVLSGDLGGTNCRSAVVEYDGDEAYLLEDTYRTWQSRDESNIDHVLEQGLGETITQFRGKIHGIGLDVAGPVDGHRTVLKAPNVRSLHNLTPYNLGRQLEKMFGVRAVVSNDLASGLEGEVQKGSMQGITWGMLENIGTGWGGARLYNGVAVAAEPGHAWLPNEGARCGCGKKDCAEASLSGGAIRRQLQQMHAAGQINIPEGMDPCAFTDREALAGTPWAVDFYTKIATNIGDVWGTNLNQCPPMERIAYMGSFMERAMRIQLFREQVRRAMLERSMFPDLHEKVEIVEVSAPKLATGESLGPLYGAASLWKKSNGNAALQESD